MDEENLRPPQDFKAEVFNKTPANWEKIQGRVRNLTSEAFGTVFEGKIFGTVDDTVAYEDVEEAFLSEDSISIVLNTPDEQFAGTTLAIPIGRMDPKRASESTETAYIYLTILENSLRGRGLVGKLTDPLFEELARKGFKFVERDALIDDGYADVITNHYKDSIVQTYDHQRFKNHGIGKERFFRIDIGKYLASQSPATSFQ